MITKFFLTLAASFFLALPLQAQTAPPFEHLKCYGFALPDSTEVSDIDATLSYQTWCYLKDPQTSETFVFNADQAQVRPELSFYVDQDGVLTHASLLDGQITYHKVMAEDYNPFNIPAVEPVHLTPRPTPRISFDSALRIRETMRQTEVALYQTFAVHEGEFSGHVASAAKKPWRGFWWSYKNQHLARGSNSPLAKYDRFARARGFSSQAVGWENTHHRYRGVWWEGHCNGWAASSILRSEPRRSKRDRLSGVTFSIDDQKGILAEADYCAHVSFHGDRYRGNGDSRRDIYPVQFHKTITYYIGQLKKPVVIDYRSGVEVDNHPVSSYSMSTIKTGTNTYTVTARLTFHKYDSKKNMSPGPAPSYTRTYKYTLKKDENGRLVGGSWLSNNPDFIWVPLSIRDCGKNNPHINFDLVAEILDLP